MHGRMVDLQRYRATSGERNFIERIKAPIFLEEVLATEIMYEPQSNLEEKVNLSILKDNFSSRTGPIHFHIISTSAIRLVKQNQLNFSSTEMNKPLSQSTVSHRSDSKKPILDAARDQMPDRT